MKKLKKGFTIVELVIVIAVVAILAGVLIPVFSNVVKKANVSKDTQLVRNLNEALAVDLNEHNTMYDALQAAKEYGYDVGKINASATDNEILWDSVNDCFVYLNGNTKEYIPNSKVVDVQNDYDFWIISNTVSNVYSTYYTGNLTEVTVSTGFDAGEVAGIKVIVDTDATRTLTVRTTSKNDVVRTEAPNATINFYGTAGEFEVIAVAGNSLHIFGQVDFLQVKEGRVVAENNAVIKAIHVADNAAKVVINAQAAVETVTKEATVTTVQVQGFDTEKIVEADAETIKAGATMFAGGNGSVDKPYLVETAEQFMNIAKVEANEISVKLLDSIDFSGVEVERAYVTLSSTAQAIDVNLNGKAINGVSAYLFNKVSNLNVYGGSINFNCETGSAGVVNTIVSDKAANVEFSNLVLGGLLNVTSAHYGPLVSYAYGLNTVDANVAIDNVVSNATIINNYTGAYTGGLIGYLQGSKATLSVTNCVINGSIQSTNAAGYVGGCSYPNAAEVVNTNNKFGGSILSSSNAQLFGLSSNYKFDWKANDDAIIQTSTASVNVVVASTTLIDKDAAMGSEIVINHTNSDVVSYVVTIEYWVNRISDGTGGYPRQINVEIAAEELGNINTGLFKYQFVQVSESNDAADEFNGAKIWANDGVYNVYDEYYQITGSKVYIRVAAYNSNGVLVTIQNVEYSNVQ